MRSIYRGRRRSCCHGDKIFLIKVSWRIPDEDLSRLANQFLQCVFYCDFDDLFIGLLEVLCQFPLLKYRCMPKCILLALLCGL